MIKHKSLLLPFLLLVAMLVGQVQRIAIVEQAVGSAIAVAAAAADDGDTTLIALSPAHEEDAAAFPAWDDGDDASTIDHRGGLPPSRLVLAAGFEVTVLSTPTAAGYWATAPPQES